MRGTKQCGDFHVPMGATTFIAVGGPQEACSALKGVATRSMFVDIEPPANVLNRRTGGRETVLRAWRGWGTLATPGFDMPSWAGGWLVQLDHDVATSDNRFGFVWDRNQDAVVLQWIRAQDVSPFL